MSTTLDVSICNETGIGSVIVSQDGKHAKADLMPDEVAELKAMAEDDESKIRAFIASIDAGLAEKLGAFSDAELKQHIIDPTCGI